MKYRLISITFFLSFNILADDSAAEKVCNAHLDVLEQARCFKELFPPKNSKNKFQTSTNNKKNEISIASGNLDFALDVMQKAFVGTYSKKLIKYRLDRAMVLYKTPLTVANYHSCASSLVAIRKFSGIGEMDILQYMIKMHSTEANLDFPSGVAYASVLMSN